MIEYSPRIYSANYPLLDKYPPEHPAVRALQLQAETRDVCVGKEIYYRDLKNETVDQEWFSAARLQHQSFSNFAYEFLSYDLVLDGWLHMPPKPTKFESSHLTDDDPLMRTLLDECEQAAIDDGNTKIFPMIAKAREFLDIYEEAIRHRFEECGIDWPVNNADDS